MLKYKRIMKSGALILFLIIPFFLPGAFRNDTTAFYSPAVLTVYKVIKIISYLIIIALYLYNKKISKILIAIILYQISMLVSTAINDQDISLCLSYAASIICFCMLTELYITYNMKLYFKVIFLVCLALISINLFLLVRNPNGIGWDRYYGYRFNFLGIDNQIAPIFIFTLMVCGIYPVYYGKTATVSSLILITCIVISTLIMSSSTCIIGCFIVLLYMLFMYKVGLAEIINSKTLSIVYIVIFFVIVIFNFTSIFSIIIENILGKSLSLTGRTEIWKYSAQLIWKSPIIGYGISDGKGLILYHGKNYYSHNAVFEVMLLGGILSLILYISIFVISAVMLYRNRKNRLSQFLAVIIFSAEIILMTEAYLNKALIYGMIIIACNIPEITGQLDRSRTEKLITIKT